MKNEQPKAESVKLQGGFYLNDEKMMIRVEDLNGRVIGRVEMSRRNLGSLLAGEYGIPATWQQWRK